VERRRRLYLAASLIVILGAGATATCQGVAYWHSLDLPHSPLDCVHARAEPANARLARRVVLVIVDGLREDRAHDLPALDALRARGASRMVASSFPTVSIPQYWAMLSGVDPAASGARTNNYRHVAWPLDSVLGDARDAGLTVAAVGEDTEPWYAPALGPMFRFAHFGEDYEAELVRALDAGADFTIVIEDAVDKAGHGGDGSGESYRAGALAADRALAALAAHLDFTKDTLVVTADHGHRDDGGHGGDEPEVMTVPLVAAGAGILPGKFAPARLVDVAPTLATLLGLPPPAASRGQPLVDMLAMPPRTAQVLLARTAQHHVFVENVLDRAMGYARAHDAAMRGLRVALLLSLGTLLVLGIRKAGAGWRDLGIAAAYLAAFVLAFHLAGGRVSLSSARTGGFFARVLVIAFFAAGIVWFAIARRVPRRFPALLLATAALAATPWFVSLAVVGTTGGLILPPPTWTAMGAWAGIPLICFGPWALADVIVVFATTTTRSGAGAGDLR
jgi:phosphopentomutase/2,3-bisphosphoglycerate-independent phosphoglycerate mutase family metalloenzyme/type I phosphodiesterase/nucleotide pyrophosphatase